MRGISFLFLYSLHYAFIALLKSYLIYKKESEYTMLKINKKLRNFLLKLSNEKTEYSGLAENILENGYITVFELDILLKSGLRIA